MSDACDFSQSHPSVAQLQAAGKVCVIAKINGANAITAAEVAAYIAAGIVVCFYYEVLATDAAGGWQAGVNAASTADAIMISLIGAGASVAQPVYFAADQNIQLANTALLEQATGYFVGLSTLRKPTITGAYGNGSFLAWLGAIGLADYFWQSSSSSYEGNGTTQPWAHIRQLVGATVPGTDDDQLYKGDVGQYPRPS